MTAAPKHPGRRVVLAGGLGGLSAAAVAACAPSAPEEPAGSGQGTSGAGTATLTIATTTDVVNFNPTIGNSRSDQWITGLMYPRLLTIADDGSKEA